MDNERRNDDGFTLVEMMAVLVIMGLLITGAVVALAPTQVTALQTRAQGDLSTINQGLALYNSQIFDYPPEEIGLSALRERPEGINNAERWNGPYLDRLPDDPWGNPYIYIYPGDVNPYELLSYGRDGEPGGEGADEDISFWEEEAE